MPTFPLASKDPIELAWAAGLFAHAKSGLKRRKRLGPNESLFTEHE